MEENILQPSLTDESSDEKDETTSGVSSTTTATRAKAPRLTKKKKQGRPPKTNKPRYKYNCHIREDHLQAIFGVQFNHHLNKLKNVFATVGSNRVSVYECPSDESKEHGIKFLQCFTDPDVDEYFYTCAWSYDAQSRDQILAAAGRRGVIRVYNTSKNQCIKHFIGHGNAVNELRFHPNLPEILLSGSKDHSLRLWNIQTDVCVAIFGGVEGHRDQVLSIDFHRKGHSIISSGMDHSLKLWRLDKPAIKDAIELSKTFSTSKIATPFPTIKEHYPDFSTRDIHGNYVDCVRWLGDFILSKSCQNSVICWMPGKLNNELKLKSPPSTFTIIQQFALMDCKIWFIRFEMNFWKRLLALGTQNGKTYVWEMDASDPNKKKCSILAHNKCVSAVRQVTFSKDGTKLITVCDDGTIWRWDMNEI